MRVVGLTGYAGVGKSTVAEYLVEKHGFTRLSFAAPLKKMLRTLNPIVGSSLVLHEGGPRSITLADVFARNDNSELQVKASTYGDEYRRLLQVLGTDCVRAVDESFWIRAAVAQMTDDVAGRYVFDDVRFPNEADTIKGYSYAGLWKIDAPGIHAANGHASEQYTGNMGEYVWIVNGHNQFERLYDQVDKAVELVIQ